MNLIISEMDLLLQLHSTFIIFTLNILYDQISIDKPVPLPLNAFTVLNEN